MSVWPHHASLTFPSIELIRFRQEPLYLAAATATWSVGGVAAVELEAEEVHRVLPVGAEVVARVLHQIRVRIWRRNLFVF